MRHTPSRLNADVEDSSRARQVGLKPLDGSALCPTPGLKPPFAGFLAASLYVKLIWGPANGSNLVSLSSAHSFRTFFCFLTLLPSPMKCEYVLHRVRRL